MEDVFRNALARLEQALAGAMERVTAVGTPAEIESFVRLLIKKKIVTEMLLDKIEAAADFGNVGLAEGASSQHCSSVPLMTHDEDQPAAELESQEV